MGARRFPDSHRHLSPGPSHLLILSPTLYNFIVVGRAAESAGSRPLAAAAARPAIAVDGTVRGAMTKTAASGRNATRSERASVTSSTRLGGAKSNFKVQISKSHPSADFSGVTPNGMASYKGE
jgi:hypothetical protein